MFNSGNMVGFGHAKDGTSGRVLRGNYWNAVLTIRRNEQGKKANRGVTLERTNVYREEHIEALIERVYMLLDEAQHHSTSERMMNMNWVLTLHQYDSRGPTGVTRIGMAANRTCRADILSSESFRLRSLFCYQPFMR